MKTEQEFIDFCLARLAAEGIDAYTEMEKDEDDEECGLRIRVPSWECKNEERTLDFGPICDFIQGKLNGQAAKGLQVSAPGADCVDVYCYDPSHAQAGKKLDKWDIRIWSVGAKLDVFDWAEIIEGDTSAAWWDGWDMPSELYFVSKRNANLATFLNYQIVDLLPIKPLSRQELVEILEKKSPLDSIHCLTPDHDDSWRLRLNSKGELELHKQKSNTIKLIEDGHLDELGRLVIDGFVTLDRCGLN